MYQKNENTGHFKKAPISDLPAHEDLVRSAIAKKITLTIQGNPKNQSFIPPYIDPVLKIVLPFLFRDKVIGCIHIQCSNQLIHSNDFPLAGELIGRHLGLICSNTIEQHHMAEFKARVRKLINVKVNQLEEAIDKAAKYNQSLKDFSYIVAHDLREPLRTINSYIELLERRYKDHFDSDAKDFMFYVTDGVARMDALI